VVHLGKSIGFLEAELRDETGLLIARATSSARLVPAEKALG
jgi:acyl-coenzyme A thioesterase PaaI-like protein